MNTKNTYRLIAMALFCAFAVSCYIEKPFPDDEEEQMGEQLPSWQKGYLDIHHISTGRGDCTLMILPDGTTMMVDAGDLGSGTYEQEIMARIPYTSRTPGEWIVRYADKFLKDASLDPKHLDYMLVTHFHSDHIGVRSNYSIPSNNGEYHMAGVSYVGNFMDIDMLVDRGWPDYEFPYIGMLDNSMMKNYRAFLKDRQENHKLPTTMFEVGTDAQFVLKKDPEAYPTFRISNVYCNGTIWDRETNTTGFMYPADASKDALSNENLHSTVINVVYGKFGYHCGGDILDNWGIETAVAQEIGQTDVYSCDHHANGTMAPDAIAATTPQVFIIPVWDYYHPQPGPLANMLDTDIYADDRLVFAAGMVESNRVRLLDDGQQIKPDGHVVVRVYEGGDEFQVYVLNDRNTKYDVIYKTDRLTSK
jgi:beta-lactamase superfamily II metal-dependent hydrolase